MVPSKVQLEKEDLEFIEKLCSILKLKSKSEYMRAAIHERIRADKRRLREMKRQKAMEAYGGAAVENLFESIEAADFEKR